MRLDWDRIKGYSAGFGCVAVIFAVCSNVVSCSRDEKASVKISSADIDGRSYEITNGNTLVVKSDALTMTYNFNSKFVIIDPDGDNNANSALFENVGKARLARDLAGGCKTAAAVEDKWKKLSTERRQGTQEAVQNGKYFLQHYCGGVS